MDNKKLMLLDGMSLINRAFYALPPLTTAAGVPTNALLGFLNIYFKLLEEEAASHVAVVFDLPGPTFRHKKFAEYKATRKPFPKELQAQIPLLKDLLTTMNIPIVSLEGYEADDVMGTLAVKSQDLGFSTTIVTGDRDLLQIATDSIKIRIPRTRGGQTITEDYFAADFSEKMGITPTEYIDMKALMGDSSDNIPGVAGIGEKTALKIIQEFGNIEAAIAAVNADITCVKPKKAAQNLLEMAEIARLSKELATIVTDAEIDFDPERLKPGEMFNPQAFEEFRRLELKSLMKKFGNLSNERSSAQISGEILDKMPEIPPDMPVVYHILREGGAARGFALAFGEKIAFLPHISALGDFFQGPNPKIGFDTKKDIHFLRQNGIEVNNLAFDLLIAGYLLGNLKDGDSIADLSLEYLKEPLDLPKAKDTQLSLLEQHEESSEDLAQTAFGYVSAISRAYPLMRDLLAGQGMDKLFYEVEIPLISVLADMESRGIAIDSNFIKEYGKNLDVDISRLTGEIYDLAGSEFNINSPKQLAKVLFEDLGLRGGKRTKTGFSTNVEVLQKLAREHAIAAKILEYRSYAKLRSTYVDGLLNAINPETGRVHTTFNQAVAATGRLSSNHPNLQNIPVRTALGRELRRAFVAAPGFVFVDADYSQIELRILAELSGDETFLTAFAQKQDIHRITAARVFQVDFDEVTDSMRSAAKAVNFGIVYGISAFALAEDINVSVREAESFIKGYFARYPAVSAYMERAVADAKVKGYSETLWGRRRPLPELSHSNFQTRAFGERAAMNMPVQGSAADIIKIAMVKVYNRLRAEGLQSRLILQIHDELLIEAAEGEIEAVRAILLDEMQNAVQMSVPLDIDINIGANWYDAK
ncbi:MAG: DNA polymerase I [Clostridiales bacterium]|jgi:DNA polymerase-1|nr:DNA polymerase I [Clostridiales bacterium]